MDTSVKYLGVHLDKILIWVTHIKTKRKSKPQFAQSKATTLFKNLTRKQNIDL